MHVIAFNPDGTASTLHTDALPLASLGRVTITRASNVEFDNDRQQWAVTWTGDSKATHYAKTRKAALAWEKSTLNERLLRE